MHKFRKVHYAIGKNDVMCGSENFTNATTNLEDVDCKKCLQELRKEEVRLARKEAIKWHKKLNVERA